MKRWLIIGYFIILVAVITGGTLDRIKQEHLLWLTISSDVIFGLVAVSVLLYGLSYKPKRFTWFWKLVPLVLVAYYVSLWYLAGPSYIDTKGSLLLLIPKIFVGVVFLFPMFYLSFKFGYYKLLPAGKFNPKFAAFILLITSLCVASRNFPLHQDRINIKVNYVAKLNEISRPANYDPNDNADPYYEKAFELSVEQPEQLSKSDVKAWPKDLPDEKRILLQNWVSVNSDALEQLKLGTQKPYYWLKYQGSSVLEIEFPYLQKGKNLTHTICARAKLNATEGNFEAAFSDLLMCYRFGMHLTGPKCLIDQLAGIAVSAVAMQTGLEILDKAKLAPDLLKDFQLQLELLSDRQSYVIDFTAEKLLAYDNIQRVFTDDGRGGGHIYGAKLLENKDCMKQLFGQELTKELKRNLEKLERRQTTELADEVYEYFSQAACKIPAQLYKQEKDFEKVADEMTKENFLLNLLTPAFARVLRFSYRIKVHTDALITTIALLRYKADKGQLPQNLDQLVAAGYLKELPMDPFSNKPLVYKHTADDFILYSFGADFDDDGGVRSKWGEGEKGGDQVFWPVKRRKKTQEQ